jgi:hypothetical protein
MPLQKLQSLLVKLVHLFLQPVVEITKTHNVTLILVHATTQLDRCRLMDQR